MTILTLASTDEIRRQLEREFKYLKCLSILDHEQFPKKGLSLGNVSSVVLFKRAISVPHYRQIKGNELSTKLKVYSKCEQ